MRSVVGRRSLVFPSNSVTTMADLCSLRLKLWLIGFLLLWTGTGCDRGKESLPRNEHGHHLSGNKLFFFADSPLHAKVSSDTENGTLTLITLGADAETIQPIKVKEIKLAMKHGNHLDKFTLTALPQPEDPAETSSRFVVKSRHLAKALLGKAGHSAELLLMLDGKQLVGRPEAAHHDHHEHADHEHHEHTHEEHEHTDAAVDVLVWHEEFEFAGNAIRLGQHGILVQSGMELEPAVSIEHHGQPVADAKVSIGLLDGSGKQILAKEQQARFEPATAEEPAHYAQAFLAVPEDANKVTIRYRIDFADGQTATRDIFIQTESHTH